MTYAVCQKHQGVLCWFCSMETSMLLCISLHTMFSAHNDTTHWLSTRVSTDAFLWSQLINSIAYFYFLLQILFCKKVMNVWARGSKFKADCYDKVLCPNCMHTTCNSTYFVMAAALCTVKTYPIWNKAKVCTAIFTALWVFVLYANLIMLEHSQ